MANREVNLRPNHLLLGEARLLLTRLEAFVQSLGSNLTEDQARKESLVRESADFIIESLARHETSGTGAVDRLQPIRPGRVVIVEDEISTRMNLRLLLESLGHSVVEAENGRQGLEALAKSEADVAFVDLHLPDMLGSDLVSQVRSGELTKRMAIYGVSSDHSPDAVAMAERSGMDGYLPKPPPLGMLRTIVESAIRQHERDGISSIPGVFESKAFQDLILIDDGIRLPSFIRQAVKDAEKNFAALNAARLADDRASWREAAHALNGVAQMLGGKGLSAAIDKAMQKNGFDEDPPVEYQFERHFVELRAAVERFLS